MLIITPHNRTCQYHFYTNTLYFPPKQQEYAKGRPHMGIYTPQIGSFPPILRQNATAGVKPCRGVLSGLAEKSLALECFAVLKERFFLTGTFRGTKKYWMYFKNDGFPVRKKSLSKPCKSLCASAQAHSFVFYSTVTPACSAALTKVSGRGSSLIR